MDLIEVLWKQDVDLGLPLVDPDPAKLNPSTSETKTSDELEKLKALEVINATKNEVSYTFFSNNYNKYTIITLLC